MLISHKHKFLTIDIPKTGTRSLRETLHPLGLVDIIGEPSLSSDFYQHATALQMKNTFKRNNWDWSAYFKFTIVRNPWDRYFSFFKYFHSYRDQYLNKSKNITWTEAEINQGKYCVELFKNRTNDKIMKSIINNHISQCDYFLDVNGDLIVDHVASFDCFNNDFHFLCEKIGLKPLSLQHENKSKNFFNKKHFYTEETIELVKKKENHVIEIMKYKF